MQLGHCEVCNVVHYGVDELDRTERTNDGRSYLVECPVCKDERIFYPIVKEMSEELGNEGFTEEDSRSSLDAEEDGVQEEPPQLEEGETTEYCQKCNQTILFSYQIHRGFADFEEVQCPDCGSSLRERIRADYGLHVLRKKPGKVSG